MGPGGTSALALSGFFMDRGLVKLNVKDWNNIASDNQPEISIVINLSVKDVLGPLPSDGSCMVIASAGGKTFALQCGLADAETCAGLLSKSVGGPSPYEFMVDVLGKFHVGVTRSEIEIVNGEPYSKLWFKSSRMRKPLKAACGSPMAAINSALAAGKSVTVNRDFMAAVVDVSDEYANMKNVIRPAGVPGPERPGSQGPGAERSRAVAPQPPRGSQGLAAEGPQP